MRNSTSGTNVRYWIYVTLTVLLAGRLIREYAKYGGSFSGAPLVMPLHALFRLAEFLLSAHDDQSKFRDQLADKYHEFQRRVREAPFPPILPQLRAVPKDL